MQYQVSKRQSPNWASMIDDAKGKPVPSTEAGSDDEREGMFVEAQD
jgi:hypothetical protein